MHTILHIILYFLQFLYNYHPIIHELYSTFIMSMDRFIIFTHTYNVQQFYIFKYSIILSIYIAIYISQICIFFKFARVNQLLKENHMKRIKIKKKGTEHCDN